MRRYGPALLALLTACSQEAPPSPDLAVNKQMIWDTLKAYHTAADEFDVDKQLTMWDSKGSLIKKHDEIIRGVEKIGTLLRDRAKAAEGQKSPTLVGQEQIDVAGDFAYVTYIANWGTQRGVITAILRRSQGKWLITHFHDTWSGTSGK